MVFMPGLEAGGGAERYAVGLAEALRDLGHTVTLATSGAVTAEAMEAHFGVSLRDVTLANLDDPPAWTLRLPVALFELIQDSLWARGVRRLRPSIFINCLFRSELPGVGSEHNVYVCHFPQRLDQTYTPAVRALYMGFVGALRRILLTRAARFTETYDAVWANSSFTAGHVLERWNTTADVVYPPCEPMKVPGVPKTRSIVAVGRFEEVVPGVANKRLDVLVETFLGMTDLHEQGWTLNLAGACREGSRHYLEALRESAAGAPVQFHPNVSFDDLRRLYSTATLYWHAQGFGEASDAAPETQEHFGITTVEAMSAGTIPVVFDTAGPKEVTSGIAEVGRWTTTDQLASETRRIIRLEPEQVGALAERCRESAANTFGRAAFSERIARLVGTRIS